MVADSYWWQIYGYGLHTNTFKMSNFWYYNKEIHPESYTRPLYVNQSGYLRRLRSADVIMIMYTEATLHKLADGFDKLLLETFCQEEDPVKERVYDIIETIVTTDSWFNQVKKKAEDRGLPLDTMLLQDARWVFEQQNKK
jgi:hypothetical protein